MKIVRDSAFRMRVGSSFHQPGTVNENVKSLNYLIKYLIQSLRPFMSVNYNTQHTPQTTNTEVGGQNPKMVIRDRALNRQTSDYTQAQIYPI